MEDMLETLEYLTRLTRGRQMTQEELDRFDSAIDRLQKAIAPCRVEARVRGIGAMGARQAGSL